VNEKQGFICREFVREDEEDVKQLIERVFKNFLGGRYWDWKYKHNPNFDPSLLMVAEKSGKVVGCNHWLKRDLKISDALKVNVILGADLIVDSEYRGHGIGKSLMLFSRSRVTLAVKQGALIRYMFADPNLSKRLYTPVADYIPAPTSTLSYFKILNWTKLSSQIEKTKETLKGKNVDLKIMFNLLGAPQLLIELTKNKIKIAQAPFANADIVVNGDLSTLAHIKSKKNKSRAVIWALLTRKLQIKGNIFSLIKFYKNIWLIKEIFSVKIS